VCLRSFRPPHRRNPLSEPRPDNHPNPHPQAAALSQHALPARPLVPRHPIPPPAAGRNVPSTSLGLKLAITLGCSVEDIFRLAPDPAIRARLAPAPVGRESNSRVALGNVGGRWVAHRLPAHGITGADGIVESAGDGEAVVRTLSDGTGLAHHVLVAGCAPLLGALASRVNRRFADARVTWLPMGNRSAMRLLAEGLVHVAGLHLAAADGAKSTVAAARRALPGRRLLLVNLTRWQQGLVVPPGNPLGLAAGADLLRPGLRLARREEGSGAQELSSRLLQGEGGGDGPLAAGHREVARLVHLRTADAGIAIESAALAEGLDFVPLAEESFDLVVPADIAAGPPVSRLMETLDDQAFRSEVEHLPGYDGSRSGHVTTVEAA